MPPPDELKLFDMLQRFWTLSGWVVLAVVGMSAPVVAQARLEPPPPRPHLVTPEIERAIERGMKYLLLHQEANGSFGATPENPDIYPVAVTSLVGLALLAHGDTPTRGEHADVVTRIMSFLLSASQTGGQTAGLFSTGEEDEPSSRKGPRPMYGHAFAMTFLAHVYGQEGDLKRRDQIRDALKRAVKLTERSITDEGGWSYRPNYFEDEGTLTVTQLQALRSCRDAGIAVPRRVIDRGVQFIEASANANGSLRYRLPQNEETRPGVTCAGFVALWNAGQYESEQLRRTQDYINRYVRHQWTYGKHAEYVEYYLAQAKWIMGEGLWQDYFTQASRTLVSVQEPDGHWEGPDQNRYGTTFATAIALLILQLPYNRLPVYQR